MVTLTSSRCKRKRDSIVIVVMVLKMKPRWQIHQMINSRQSERWVMRSTNTQGGSSYHRWSTGSEDAVKLANSSLQGTPSATRCPSWLSNMVSRMMSHTLEMRMMITPLVQKRRSCQRKASCLLEEVKRGSNIIWPSSVFVSIQWHPRIDAGKANWAWKGNATRGPVIPANIGTKQP